MRARSMNRDRLAALSGRPLPDCLMARAKTERPKAQGSAFVARTLQGARRSKATKVVSLRT